ncbi:MAG: hypothetical protein PHQ36_07385 [Anaerolineales bacterium]|nr:hypothetical protein [Anaerolineales bacterium]
MADDLKNDSGSRMRNLTGGSSPMARLPKKSGGAPSFLPNPPHPQKNDAPTPLPQKEKKSAPEIKAANPKASKFNIGPVFWTFASVLSLSVNVILVVILLFVFNALRKAHLTDVTALGPNLLGGLYTNFEKMDAAHITTNIPVETTIPVKFDLQLNQRTEVELSQNVTITNAFVTVNTGGLNINRAAATVTLPQGTILPIILNLTVPVDTTVQVALNVAVDIPLEQTQLHEPFVGLREVVAPLYCLFKSDAVGMNGQSVCK